MKKTIFSFVLELCCCMSVFSQATSLTVDCQTPGWLSSMINFGDQQTLENIKVTGYINGTDIQFLYDLNNRSLTGVIDLEDVSIVKGGTLYTNGYPRTVEKDNEMPQALFYDQKKRIQKFIYPKTLVKEPSIPFRKSGMVDSLIWTSTNVNYLNISNGVGYSNYVNIPEGIEFIDNLPGSIRIVLPNSITKVFGGTANNLTIYSLIKEPEAVYAQREEYSNVGGYNPQYYYWAVIANSTFYIPKGTKDKYLRSDFATMDSYQMVNGNYQRMPNNNVFIEYYDIDRVEIKSPITIYKGDEFPIEVTIYPDANLVSWINYVSADPEIVSVQSDGRIAAKGYGQTEISATPHVFIDGLETKTGSCIVNVLAHVEGVDMPATMSLHIGEQKNINAQTLPLGITDNKITYTSNDLSVATVNNDGVIIGEKKGSCTITATSVEGGYTATCRVTVTQPVETLALEKHSISLKVGETDRLYAQISPATADNKTVVWASSNEQVVTVDQAGNVKAIGAGEAWITAMSVDNQEATDICKVTVIQPVTGISLNQSTCELNEMGESFNLEVTLIPNDASNKNIRWTSSDESVCIVSQGKVVAVGFGTCFIIATTEDGGYMATCEVEVTKPIEEYILGDVNRDGKISIGDVAALVEILQGRDNVEPYKYSHLAADVDEDGSITLADLAALRNIILGRDD